MVQRCAPALIAYQRGFLNFTACELSRDIIRREGKRERERDRANTASSNPVCVASTAAAAVLRSPRDFRLHFGGC